MSHVHDAFQCPVHCRGCDCPDLDRYLCNPYWVNGHCPSGLLVMPDDPRYVPEPKRGGTFFYCPWILKSQGRITWCAQGWRGTRFRKLSAYRRHWRRHHAQAA